jgi:hypothetical protein
MENNDFDLPGNEGVLIMPGRKMLCLGVTILLLTSGVARAQHGGGGHMHHGGGHHPGMGGMPLAAVGGGYAGYWYAGPYMMGGPGYYDPYYPGMMTTGSAGFFSPFAPMPPPMPVRGPLLQSPPPQAVAQWARGAAKPAAAPGDPKRAAQLLTFGDRFFRAGNLKKAEERYIQARNTSSNQAAPHLRLAQIALTRGNYTEAANRLRDAETAEPGWVLTAPDIQSLYGEPTEFVHQLSRLESYVQAHPDDRDAWLVLGAEWFLSGRTTRAADVFLRLDDPRRKPDVALAAFLIAINHGGPSRDDVDQPTR